jgi:chaperonin GroEL
MSEKKEGREVLTESELQVKVLEGAHAAYQSAAISYGPKGKNVILEKGFGRPLYTRDGITILRDTFFSDRGKQLGAAMVREASEASNQVAGDGSTAAGMLTYLLYDNGLKSIAAGNHPMDVADIIVKDSYLLLEELKKFVIPVKDNQLKDVATVAAGNPLIGQLIAEAVLYVGQDGGILTEKAPIAEVEREYIDGYYLQSGFTALQGGKKELVDPYVIVSSKRLSSSADTIELLNGVMKFGGLEQGQIPRVLFIGNFEDAAYTTIVNTINAGQIDAVIIKTPPMYGELGKYLLEDIAIYAGCQPITENTKIKSFVSQISDRKYLSSYIGRINKVIASKGESTLFADKDTEAVKTRIQEIKDQIKDESVDGFIEKLRDRVAKLEGKIAIFKIGGATDTEKERLEFQIEDAINSTRHAYTDGIVPGGGVTLLQLSKLDISDIYKNSLQTMFKQLLINANLPSELKLDEALKAPKGQGYDLRKGGELVDVIKEGIIDPYIVPKEVIFHATSMASETLKLGLGLVFSDDDKKSALA